MGNDEGWIDLPDAWRKITCGATASWSSSRRKVTTRHQLNFPSSWPS